MKNLLLGVACVVASVAPALADTASKKIALSNNYAGNSWRQAMLQSWKTVGDKAVADGIVAQADAFTTSQNQATEQAAQIQNMILQGYDAIVLDAASPTALNGAVNEACQAGIKVISFDGIVTAPCAWRVTVNFEKWGSDQIDYLASRLPDGGNLLEIRGLAGTSVDADISKGIHAAIEKHPNLKIVASVNGDWAQDVTQKAVAGVLPSLPKIAGVVTQGGDGFGAAMAFKAAGRDQPIIIMGNRQDELAWWKQEHDRSGYTTISSSVGPGIATLALWVAQQILDGKDVPKDLVVPLLSVDQAGLDAAVAATPVGSVANKLYTQDEVKSILAGAK